MRQLYVILLAVVGALAQDEGPEVDVGVLGRVRGAYASTLGGNPRNYSQFLGIRYATQPIRFLPSQLAEDPLTDDGSVFNATQYGARCAQPDEADASEDCLFLNIFAPINLSDKKIPVMLFIPGAGFTSGGGDWLRGERLLNRDIILVLLNHRYGIHGAANLEVPEAPGNAMLYDTATALRWIQTFITHFGGDPNLVTIAGQSSGGAMTSHSLVSPLFKGLVHRAIAQSGSTLDPSTFALDHVGAALKVAANAGCYEPSEPLNRTQVALCLRNIPHHDLSAAQYRYQKEEMLDASSIGFDAINPSLQNFPLGGIEPLIPSRPESVLEKGEQNDIPLIMLVPRDDGSFALKAFYDDFLIPNGLENDTEFGREGLVSAVFKAVGVHDPGHTVSGSFSKTFIIDEARQSGNFSEMVLSLFDLMSVIFFKAGTLRQLQLHSKLNPNTYFISFEYEGRYKRHPFLSNYQPEVGHADDNIYMFRLSGDFNEEEQALSDLVIDYYVNFMYTGDPNTFPPGDGERELPVWPQFGLDPNKYLVMDANTGEASDYQDSWVIANRKEDVDVSCPPTIGTTSGTTNGASTDKTNDSTTNLASKAASLSTSTTKIWMANMCSIYLAVHLLLRW